MRASAGGIRMMAPTRLPESTSLPGQVSISGGENVVMIVMMIVVTSVVTFVVMTEGASFVVQGVALHEGREDTDHDGTMTIQKGQTSAPM